MNRFFIPLQNIIGDKATISDKDEVHHIRDVLRLKAGEAIIIFDEQGNEYRARIKSLSYKEVGVKVEVKVKVKPDKRIKITVACAIPKKSKMDDIIDKLTQLGVDKIIPLLTERVIVKLDKRKEALRLTRWRKIALNSAKQSQRKQLPVIDSIRNIQEVLAKDAEDFDLKLIPTLAGKRKRLKEIMVKSRPKNILILISPEGDFTPREVELAKSSGCIPVSLGDLVLRVETAAVVAASFLKIIYENH